MQKGEEKERIRRVHHKQAWDRVKDFSPVPRGRNTPKGKKGKRGGNWLSPKP